MSTTQEWKPENEKLSNLSPASAEVLAGKELDLISVIVPIYNVEAYLPKCIETICAQTYSYIEILLINDGSTDRSGEICEEFARKDPRIRVFHKENSGVSASRNLGIDNAHGKYLTFIDGDDFIIENYVERLYVEAVRHQVDIAVSDYCRFNDADATFYFTTKESYTKEITAFDYFDEIFKTETLAYVVVWGKLIATKLFNGVSPIRFPKGRIAGEDKLVTHLLAWKAQKIVYIHEPNYVYRTRPDSITNSQASLKRSEDDIFGCEQRMLDLILMGYDVKPAIDWYHYILEIHERSLKAASLEQTPLYRKIEKKLALINNHYQ